MKKLAVEFIGTFFLVFTIGCVIVSGNVNPALAIGSILMVMVYAGGHISGAHYNPAVTLAVLIRGRIKTGEAVQYWIVQLVAGIIGALCAYSVTGSNPNSIHYDYTANATLSEALAAEILGTFALAYVVLNVATSKNTAGNSFYGLAIGFTVGAMAAAVGKISGGAFNPAVGLGRSIGDAIATGNGMSSSWIYLVGPGLGGTLAGIVFKMLNPDDK